MIRHWITPGFKEREEVLEFTEVKGFYSGADLAKIVDKTLVELNIRSKLFAITRDNAGNNGTLCDKLYKILKRTYNDKENILRKPRM